MGNKSSRTLTSPTKAQLEALKTKSVSRPPILPTTSSAKLNEKSEQVFTKNESSVEEKEEERVLSNSNQANILGNLRNI